MKIRPLIQPEHSTHKSINWFVLFTEGHQKAFTHIFKLQYPGLFLRTSKLLENAEAAKKIVLLAFVDAWASREGFTSLDELKRFIRESVRENCSTYRLTLAKDHKEVAVGILDRSSFFDEEHKGPHLERIHKEILAEMFSKLESLPEDNKWILHHAITERKSLAQLAAKWHVSENAAAIRKSRAFRTLLSLLADPGSSFISH